MKVSLFLGAGASAAYGMPTTKAFKTQMMKKCGGKQEWVNMLDSCEDIEEVLTTVMEITSFLKTRGGRHLESHHPQIKETFKSMKSFENIIKHEVHEAYSWNARYNAVLDSVLGSWLDLIKEFGQDINIFTTNYDRSVEEHCSNLGQPFKDGFEPDRTSDYMRWTGMREDGGQYALNMGYSVPPVLLFKLHGSLGWKYHASHGPVRVNYEKKSSDPNQRDLLIYPSMSPKTEEAAEPYATIFDRFHKRLMSSDACIVVGFSFRDEQIRDKFVEFVRQGKKLVVVSPTGEADVVRQIPGSKACQNPQSQMVQKQVVKTVLVPSPSEEMDGGYGIMDTGGGGRGGLTRGEATWADVTSLAKVFPRAQYSRAGNMIYLIENAVGKESISGIISAARDIVFGNSARTYYEMPFK